MYLCIAKKQATHDPKESQTGTIGITIFNVLRINQRLSLPGLRKGPIHAQIHIVLVFYQIPAQLSTV
jgi:hypothetical protein